MNVFGRNAYRINGIEQQVILFTEDVLDMRRAPLERAISQEGKLQNFQPRAVIVSTRDGRNVLSIDKELLSLFSWDDEPEETPPEESFDEAVENVEEPPASPPPPPPPQKATGFTAKIKALRNKRVLERPKL